MLNFTGMLTAPPEPEKPTLESMTAERNDWRVYAREAGARNVQLRAQLVALSLERDMRQMAETSNGKLIVELAKAEKQRDELLAAARKAMDECCDLIGTPAGLALDDAILSIGRADSSTYPEKPAGPENERFTVGLFGTTKATP